jgi:hypothetical protein
MAYLDAFSWSVLVTTLIKIKNKNKKRNPLENSYQCFFFKVRLGISKKKKKSSFRHLLTKHRAITQ